MTALPIPADLAWSPARDVHLIAVGDDLVVLDVAADAYLCAPGVARSVRRDAQGGLAIADPALAAELRDAGLIVPAVSPGQTPPDLPSLPRRSAITAPLPAVRWRDAPGLAACVLDAALAYRGRSLADLMRAARRGRGAASGPRVTPELLDRVRDFQRWIPYAPVSGKCLLRSFLLLRHLHRHGHEARWVFGVRTWPFQAHCWLQVEDMVLDDDFDRLVAFQPIAVV